MPMGALTAARRESADARYEGLTEIGESPFHYGVSTSPEMLRMVPSPNHRDALLEFNDYVSLPHST